MSNTLRGIIYNEDSDNFLYSLVLHHRVDDVNEEMLCAYVDQMQDSGVTDCFFCVAGLYSAIPSKVLTFIADRASVRWEDGKPVKVELTPKGTNAVPMKVRFKGKIHKVKVKECR